MDLWFTFFGNPIPRSEVDQAQTLQMEVDIAGDIPELTESDLFLSCRIFNHKKGL